MRLKIRWGTTQRVLLRIISAIPPDLVRAVRVNRRLAKKSLSSASAQPLQNTWTAKNVDSFSSDAAAVWQAENDRIAGLGNKAVGVLAIDALILGVLTQTIGLGSVPALLGALSGFYIVTSVLAAGLSLVPRPRLVPDVNDILAGRVGYRMLECMEANRAEGIRLNNLGYAALADALRGFVLLTVAVLVGAGLSLVY